MQQRLPLVTTWSQFELDSSGSRAAGSGGGICSRLLSLAAMSNNFLALLAIVWPPIVVWLVLKFIPGSISKFVDKEIERRSDVKLEHTKAEIQGAYSTLKNSVDMLTASNTGLHPHIIESVTALWDAIIKMRNEFGDLSVFDSIILAEEAKVAFADQASPQNAKILGFVRAHEGDLQNPIRAQALFDEDFDKHRLFCGDRLWLIFYVFRAIHLRGSLLISWSFQKNEFQDWRDDSGIKQLLGAALQKDLVKQVIESKFGGFSKAVAQLEADFLHESVRVMSGSKAMADNLADVQAMMLLRNAVIAGNLKQYYRGKH